MAMYNFVVVILCQLLLLEKGLIKADLPMCDGNIGERCCLCQRNDTCTQSCPEGFQKLSTPEATCTNLTVESRDTTLGTTDNPGTTTPFVSFSTDDPDTGQDTICVKCEPDEYLNNQTTMCEACSSACIGCRGPSSHDCIICKYKYENMCVKSCPPDTKMVNVTMSPEGNTTNVTMSLEGHTIICEPVVDSKDSKKLYIYIGAGAGGGLLLIIILVVVICCVCRRKKGSDIAEKRQGKSKSERTAMSRIIEDRDHDKKPERPAVSASSTMGNTQTSRRHNYENTENPGVDFAKKLEQQSDEVLRYTKDPTVKEKLQERIEAGHSIYENESMVRLHQNIDLTHTSTEDINRALEAQEVSDLPDAPGFPAARTVKTPTKQTKSKVGIIKRLSQRVSRRLAKDNNKAKPAGHHPDDYIDMSHSGQPPEEDYENIILSTGTQPKPSSNQSVGQVGGKSYNQSTDQVGGRGQGQSESVDESQLEDYENLVIRNSEPVNEEDYENPPEVVRKLQQEEAESQLEDYENVEMRKKDNTTDDESPYVNYAFKKT